MATKTKTDTNGASAAFDSMAAVSNEAVKDGMEKVMKSVGDFSEFSRETVEAVMSSANALSKNMETLNSEAISYSKQSLEDGMSAAKAAMTSRSLQELIEVNTDYTKSAFDAYMGQLNKFSDMMVAAAKDTTEPLNDRFSAMVEMVQSYRP
ncbi:MAG: TIGR01841 family phasin [Pseudomonadota bacterium]